MMPSGVALTPAEGIGFGVDDPLPLRLRHVRKPPRKEPAGAGWAGCRLWGFGWVAAWVGAAPAGVVCVGPTMAVAIWSLRRRSAGWVWRGRRGCRRGRP